MARLFPESIDDSSHEAPLEALTVARLRDALPEDWWVVHGLYWTLPKGRRINQGEVDFAVISPAGAVALIEQKNGPVLFESGEYFKQYGPQRKSVTQQMGRSRTALMKKLAIAGVEPRGVVSVLYAPDVDLVRVSAAGIDDMSVVGAREASQLPQRVNRLIGGGSPDPDRVKALVRFFAGELEFRPSLHAMHAGQQEAQVRLSGPLRLLLEGFSMQPLRLRLEACAGSGKSEFVRILAERACSRGKRTLIVCYNRPLSVLLRTALPSPALVDTWFGFLRRLGEGLGLPVVFPARADTAFWAALAARIDDRLSYVDTPPDWMFDAILVDEAQDLGSDVLARLERHLLPDGDFVWVGDPDQARVGQPGLGDTAGFATFRLRENFRTPRALASEIADLAPPGTVFRNPMEGTGLRMVDATGNETADIAAEVGRLLAVGHRIEDLLLLDLGNLASQQRFGDRVGEHSLRRFTGEYTADGEQVITPGDLAYDTVWRYKGQQHPYVIVLGLSPAGLSDGKVRRALYIALTRATVGASIVLRGG